VEEGNLGGTSPSWIVELQEKRRKIKVDVKEMVWKVLSYVAEGMD
jgi:hypothetical protein